MKMKKIFYILVFVFTSISSVNAAMINLVDWSLNTDELITYAGDPVPSYVNDNGFDFMSGLGTLSVTISGVGAHSVFGFFDHDIDVSTNSFFNEVGDAFGSPNSGQSWEIDEPGYGSFPANVGTGGLVYWGDIFNNFITSSLDNMIFFDAIDGQSLLSADDVSMAMGWDFILDVGETALINFIISDTEIPSGFYLAHTDPQSNQTIYFSSNLNLQSSIQTVPEPGTAVLLTLGFAVFVFAPKRSIMRKIWA